MAFPYLIVRARGRLCALPVGQVVETLRLPLLVAEAAGAKGLLGTAMLRGDLVAVLDLGALLGFPEAPDPESPDPESLYNDRPAAARAVSVRLGLPPEQTCAVLAVDEVIGVKALEPEALRSIALPGGGELPMGRFDAGFARLIDASGLVDASGLIDASGLVDASGSANPAALAADDLGAAA